MHEEKTRNELHILKVKIMTGLGNTIMRTNGSYKFTSQNKKLKIV